MTRMRADQLLVARGLAESRAKARAAIEAGGVTADGARVSKASDLIAADAVVTSAAAFAWVSRAGVKLAHALEAFGIDPGGRVCLDVGASTGGFTEVLLSRGAALVYAVDVGQGQLHARLQADSRVASLERIDARALTRTQIAEAPSLVVCDVSFIGADKALATPLSLATPAGEAIVLIKPQFEAGPGRMGKHGVLSEAEARSVGAAAAARLDGMSGFRSVAQIDSPIRGGDGNLEMLLHLRRG